MLIKTYIADTEEEAIKMMQSELGSEAIVLTQKQLKSQGIKSFISSTRVEITAAIDEVDLPKEQKEAKEQGSLENLGKVLGKFSQEIKEKEAHKSKVVESKKEEVILNSPLATYQDPRLAKRNHNQAMASLPKAEDQVELSSAARRVQSKKVETKADEEELASQSAFEMNKLLVFGKKLSENIGKLEEKQESSPKISSKKLELKGEERASTQEEELRRLIREEVLRAHKSVDHSHESSNPVEGGGVCFLQQKGVNRGIALQVEERLNQRFAQLGDKEVSKASRIHALRSELSDLIHTTGPLRLSCGVLQPLALVGPTGVGKTSSLAKIAAFYSKKMHKKVAVFSFDTEKAGGAAQIEEMIRPLSIPLVKGHTKEDLKKAVEDFADSDILLIDTAGRGQKDFNAVQELKEIFAGIANIKLSLCMSAGMKDLDIFGYIQSFSCMKIDNIIFTKMDETIGNGVLVNVCQKTKLAISYLTKGKDIFADLELADASEIAKSILVENNAEPLRGVKQQAFA